MSIILKVTPAASTITVTIASPAVVTLAAHGLKAGDIVYFKTTGALPTGITAGVGYYVLASGLTSSTFKISTSNGGTAVNSTGSQSGVHTLSIDRSTYIDSTTFSLNRALTNQVDTLDFSVNRAYATDWEPELLNDIKVYDTDGSTILFAGLVVNRQKSMTEGIEIVKCQARDYSFDMDRKLVVQTYENETVNDIIANIISTYLTGFTGTNVDCTLNVDYIALNYEYPSKVLQQLAQLVSYDWYVDENRDIHFFAKDARPAPFNLDDTAGKYYIDTLVVKQDATQIKNDITVRGGEYLGNSFTESYIADGTQLTFPLMYKYNTLTFKVGGVSKTVGVDNLDDPTAFDALYNFQEKVLKFTATTKPAASAVVAITGFPYIPVITKRTDGASIGAFGSFEYKIVDSTINTKDGAQSRAAAEISNFGETIDEGSFQTKESGLDVGQVITVQSTLRNLNEDFVITRITSTITNPTQFLHKITLTTTATFGMVEFLQGLLMAKDKEIKIADDEVLDQLLGIGDSFSLSDSLSITTSSPPYVYGTAKWGFATWA